MDEQRGAISRESQTDVSAAEAIASVAAAEAMAAATETRFIDLGELTRPSHAVSSESTVTHTGSEEGRRVSAVFAPSTYAALVELTRDSGSLSEALRRAIALAKWFQDMRDQGAHVLVEHNGKVREIVQL